MQKQTVDFTALKGASSFWLGDLSIENPIFLTCVGIVLVASLFLGLFTNHSNDYGLIVNILMFLMLFTLALGALGLVIMLFAGPIALFRRKRAIKKFIEINNTNPQFNSEDLLKLLPPILNQGTLKKISNLCVLNIDGQDVYVFDYEYSKPDINNEPSLAYKTVILTSLTKSYPDIFLDGSLNGPSLEFLPQERISLEGDFDKSFKLYAPVESKALALAIITPDVMQTLMVTKATYDVELCNQTLAIITEQNAYGYPYLPQLINNMSHLLKELLHKDATWRPVFSQDGSNMTLQENLGASTRLIGYTVMIIAFIVFIIMSIINHRL